MASFQHLNRPLERLLADLRRAVAAWEYVAGPLMALAWLQGFSHEISEEMGGRLLNLSSNLNNNHGNPRLGNYLNNILLSYFPRRLEISALARQNRKIFASQMGWERWGGCGRRGQGWIVRLKAMRQKGFTGLGRLALSRLKAEERLELIRTMLRRSEERRARRQSRRRFFSRPAAPTAPPFERTNGPGKANWPLYLIMIGLLILMRLLRGH